MRNAIVRREAKNHALYGETCSQENRQNPYGIMEKRRTIMYSTAKHGLMTKIKEDGIKYEEKDEE